MNSLAEMFYQNKGKALCTIEVSPEAEEAERIYETARWLLEIFKGSISSNAIVIDSISTDSENSIAKDASKTLEEVVSEKIREYHQKASCDFEKKVAERMADIYSMQIIEERMVPLMLERQPNLDREMASYAIKSKFCVSLSPVSFVGMNDLITCQTPEDSTRNQLERYLLAAEAQAHLTQLSPEQVGHFSSMFQKKSIK